jgi:hypothetical protein
VKAIETVYKGYRFRSRLEARWAVFFDALGVNWLYEHEGYELLSGRYLPDFFLPESKLWVEVKPLEPSPLEQVRAEDLLTFTGQSVFISNGLPDSYGTLHTRQYNDEYQVWEERFKHVVLSAKLFTSKQKPYQLCAVVHDPDFQRSGICRDYSYEDALVAVSRETLRAREGTHNYRALMAARAARFEFGEAGA